MPNQIDTKPFLDLFHAFNNSDDFKDCSNEMKEVQLLICFINQFKLSKGDEIFDHELVNEKISTHYGGASCALCNHQMRFSLLLNSFFTDEEIVEFRLFAQKAYRQLALTVHTDKPTGNAQSFIILTNVKDNINEQSLTDDEKTQLKFIKLISSGKLGSFLPIGFLIIATLFLILLATRLILGITYEEIYGIIIASGLAITLFGLDPASIAIASAIGLIVSCFINLFADNPNPGFRALSLISIGAAVYSIVKRPLLAMLAQYWYVVALGSAIITSFCCSSIIPKTFSECFSKSQGFAGSGSTSIFTTGQDGDPQHDPDNRAASQLD